MDVDTYESSKFILESIKPHLVKGSTIEGELQEVGLKLDVLADQLTLNINSQQRSSSRH